MDFDIDIWTASSIGDLELIRQIVTESNVNDLNQSQWTCLMYSSYFGHASIVSFLLQSKPLALNALHLAAKTGHTEVVKILLKSRKDQFLQQNLGKNRKLDFQTRQVCLIPNL